MDVIISISGGTVFVKKAMNILLSHQRYCVMVQGCEIAAEVIKLNCAVWSGLRTSKRRSERDFHVIKSENCKHCC